MQAPFRDRLRTLVRTRSWRATQALYSDQPGQAVIRLPGFANTVRLRTGTRDGNLLRRLVWWQGRFPEYPVPDDLQPRVILDIGANIGAVSLALASQFPDARLYSFEPFPANFELLQHNLSGYPNAQQLPYGLGCETTEAVYTQCPDPKNFGGGGFFGGGPNADERRVTLPVMAVREAFDQLGITQVDLIKIDVEGAEYDVMTSMPVEVLSGVRRIVGELHGYRVDELMTYLGQWFDIDQTHTTSKLNYFIATNRR